MVLKELPAMFGIMSKVRVETLNFWQGIAFIFNNRAAISWTTFLFVVGSVAALWGLSKYAKKVPWHMVACLLAIAVGYFFSQTGRFQTFGEELQKDATFDTFFNEVFSTKFYKVGLSDFRKDIDLEFFLNCTFLAVMTIVESTATIRLAMHLTKQRFRSSVELYALGASNILAGAIGLLPLSLPISRNIMTLGAGARSKAYTLFCFIICVTFGWAFWGVFLKIPMLIKTIICVATGISLVDIAEIKNYVQVNSKKMYGYVCICMIAISLLIDVSFCVAFFYIGFLGLYLQKRSHSSYTIGNPQDFQNQIEVFSHRLAEPRLQLQDYMNLNLTSKRVREEPLKHIIVYQMRGVFCFLHDNEHISNIKISRKTIVVLDFRFVEDFDLELITEYLPLLNRIIKDSRMELFVTGIPLYQVQNNLLLQESWVQQMMDKKRLIFIK